MFNMNRLSTTRRGQIVSCLVEGMSMRATSRVVGAARNTVDKLLVELGEACAEYQHGVFHNLPCQRIECDEIWSFVDAKAKNVPDDMQDDPGVGDVWTWVAIDADTKLVPSWLVGKRTTSDAYYFLSDLKSRLRGPVQLTTDGHRPYLTVVEPLFGADGIDFAMLHKIYGVVGGVGPERTYSPPTCTGIDKRVITVQPDPALISTNYVERQNLTTRMGTRRFTRLTNGFSKNVENHAAPVAMHFMYYNFGRPHHSLGRRVTPAMASGVADHVWSVWDIAGLLDSK
jgi:IS1 family transposase